MAFGTAETAKLIVDLSLTGNFQNQLGKVNKTLATTGARLSDTSSRAYKAGQQIGTGIKRGAVLAVAAIGTLTGFLAYAVKQGQEAANAEKIYAQAIRNSGKVSAAYVGVLNKQQKALENLAGVDDELIKSEQTRLIQMGLTGKAVEKLTPLILDASKATGRDLLTVTIAAGKAANGNATALQRLGIQVDKTRFKVDPLAETIRVLNERFGGTTKALSGSFDVRMAALRENLKDIAENAGQQLLPALTRIVDVVGTKLVPAFGKFVDRILPSVVKGLDEFSALLENGGAEKGINAITDALGPLVDLVKIAAAPVKAIVSAFLSLPHEVQTVLIGAFAVNKLTGGLVTNITGGLVGAVVKGLGSIIGKNIVQPVFVTNQIPGLPGGGGLPVGAGAAGGAGLGLGTAAALVLAPVTIAGIGLAIKQATDPNGVKDAIGKAETGISRHIQDGNNAGIKKLIEIAQNTGDLTALKWLKDHGIKVQNPPAFQPGFPVGPGKGPLGNKGEGRASFTSQEALRGAMADALAHAEIKVKVPTIKAPKVEIGIEGLRGKISEGLKPVAETRDIESMRGKLAAGLGDTRSAAQRAGEVARAGALAGAASVVGAIHGIQAPITNVKVDVAVTASGIKKTVTINNRYGPATGSAQSDLSTGTSGHLGR